VAAERTVVAVVECVPVVYTFSSCLDCAAQERDFRSVQAEEEAEEEEGEEEEEEERHLATPARGGAAAPGRAEAPRLLRGGQPRPL